jgi:hypothetical protein
LFHTVLTLTPYSYSYSHLILTLLTPCPYSSLSIYSQVPMSVSKVYFDHEQLLAYQRSIQFVAWSSQLLEKIPTKLAVCDQLDRASTSAPLNIAERNGKYTAPDR